MDITTAEILLDHFLFVFFLSPTPFNVYEAIWFKYVLKAKAK